jgi:hypothetical protein
MDEKTGQRRTPEALGNEIMDSGVVRLGYTDNHFKHISITLVDNLKKFEMNIN